MASTSLLLRGRHTHALLSRALSTAATTTAGGALPSSSSIRRRISREHDPDRAVSMIKALDTASLPANATRNALPIAARRLSHAGRIDDAEALLYSHLRAATTELHLVAVLNGYSAVSLPEKALSAFRSAAPSLPFPVTALSFNAVLSVFLRCLLDNRIPEIFAELSKEFFITPDAVSYSILTKAYCRIGDDEKAQQLLVQMREQGIPPNTRFYTSLIDSMYKQKKTEEAERLWKEMLESGCQPDVATYNVKAMYYGFHGRPEAILELIAEMEAAGLKPDIGTYNFLMISYCRNGKGNDAKLLFNSLSEKGYTGNASTYKHMMAELCALEDFDAALGIFKESWKRNKIPNFKTMKGLVEGLTKGGRVSAAKWVIAKVKKRFPENSLSGWKELEKELGLDSDSGDTPQAKSTSDEPLSQAKSDIAEVLELEQSVVNETNESKDSSSDDEAPEPEAFTAEEALRRPA